MPQNPRRHDPTFRSARIDPKESPKLFKSDLNAGVILNHAPLWRMIGLPKWRPKQVPPEELEQLIAIRTSHAVKAALEALASAPTSGGAKKSAKKSSRS